MSDPSQAPPAASQDPQPSGATAGQGGAVGGHAPSGEAATATPPAETTAARGGSRPAQGRRRRRPLSILDAKRGIADAILDLKAAPAVEEPGRCRTLVYAYSQLASVIESERLSDLERRIAALEATQAGRQGGSA